MFFYFDLNLLLINCFRGIVHIINLTMSVHA